MKKLHLILLAIVAMLVASCNRDPHFMTNRQYRHQVETDFNQRKAMLDSCFGQDMQYLYGRHLGREQSEALMFLMAYMPYSDMADYTFNFFRQQVEYAFMARDTMPWGKLVPEDIFRHFVLVYRVNNENLDTARVVFFNELKDRVKGLDMEQAALDVNHWCHEHVAYRAADARTSAPLATMRTSLGRCGEESTFAVTALRAVGIPARQCYTPRWAHCDDNHAWVEVWIASDDKGHGEWKFLGACEPDPELNMGWFSIPSTRCMMVHSKAFGRYHGDEEVVKATSLYSELNLLSHYAPTKKVTITVQDIDGHPIEGAKVKFKLYNYSEYYTLATIPSDKAGQASLTTGLGDLLIWACKDDLYGYQKIDVRQQDTMTLTLWREGAAAQPYLEDLDMVPPEAGIAKVTPSEEAATKNAERIAYEDSVRTAYMATFPTKENFKLLLPKDWYWDSRFDFSDDRVWEILQKSEGNYAEIAKFLNNWNAPYRSGEHIYDYLKSFSDKDLRDITAEVLQSHVTGFDWADHQKGTGYYVPYTYEVYKKGIMPARISNELVRPWRQSLKEALQDIKDAEALRDWTLKHIAVDDTGNYYNCPISPCGVYKLRHSDAHSRDIFYVAACRSLGIPAYLDNATNTIYVWQGNAWQQVTLSQNNQQSKDKGKLTLTYSGKEPAKPIYYPHFTLQKYEDGDFVTFDFEDDPRMATFPATIQLDKDGYYCLSTGNRYPDGKVLNRLEFFSFNETGNAITREIVLRPLVETPVDGQGYPMVDPHFEIYEGMATLADYADNTGMMFINFGDGKHYREPSKHLVKELLEQREALARWGGMIYAIAPAEVHGQLRQLANIDLTTAERCPLMEMVVKALGDDFGEDYPLAVFIDKRGQIRYHSKGYHIGSAEQLLKSAD